LPLQLGVLGLQRVQPRRQSLNQRSQLTDLGGNVLIGWALVSGHHIMIDTQSAEINQARRPRP
jgi:hypothetical protein